MKKIIFFYLMLLASTFGWGQSKLSPYTTQFLNSMKKADLTGDSTVLKRYQVYQSPDAHTYISAFIHLAHTDNLNLLEEKGVQVGTVTDNIITARIPIDMIQEITEMEMVKYVEMGAPVYTTMDEAKISVRADKIHQGIDLPNEFCGKNIVVGTIDNGFDYGHPNFWNSDKREFRIKRVWDQNKKGKAPESYVYGTEYKTEESILAALTDSEESAHGTHALGIAAGADHTDEHPYGGIATEADLVLVSLNSDKMITGDNTTIIDGINYIFNYAESVGKPCVINLSLGSYMGPHDGSSAFDRMADALQGPGRLLVGAIGNDGSSKSHVSKEFQTGQKDTLRTFIEFKLLYPQISFIEIWGDANMEYSFVPVIYSVHENKVVSSCEPVSISVATPGNKEYNFDLVEDHIAGSITVTSEINPYNSKPHMLINANFYKSDEYRVGFYIISDVDGSVHIWTDNYYSNLSNFGEPDFSDGDSESSMGEIGGTGKRIISVGAYTTRDHYYRYGIYYPSGEELAAIASFSSRGPTPDGRTKPDITAPGTYIISSLSSYCDKNKIKATSISWNGKVYDYGYMQGTSMASPLVAGILATWLQANPELTPEAVREVLKSTSIKDQYTGTIPEKGSNIWGHGKIDAWTGLKECIRQASGINEDKHTIPFIIMLKEGKRCRLVFTSDQVGVSIRFYTVNGTEIFADKLKTVYAGEEYSVNLDNKPEGIYFMKIVSDGCFYSQKIMIR